MSAPKHLWSGDWEAESDAAAAARAAASPPQAPGPDAAPPTPAAAPVPGTAPPRAPAAPAPDRRAPSARPRRPGARAAAARHALRRLARPAAVALVAAGIAVGLVLGLGSAGGGAPAASVASLPFLGVEMQSLPGGAVLVDGVVPGSPAALAGLGPGDVIVAVDGHAVASPGDVDAQLARMRPGERVRLRIQRGGAYLQATARLARAPAGVP